MKDWTKLSEVLMECTPLVGQLLDSAGADVLGSLLASHLEVSNDPDVILERIQDNTVFLSSVQAFEDKHKNRFEAMLFTVMQIAIDGGSHVDITSKSNIYPYLLGVFTGAFVAYISVML